MKLKRCIVCGKTKPLSEFHTHLKSSDGYKHECKVCVSLRNKSYYQENKDKLKQQANKYYHKNVEKIKKYKRQKRFQLTEKEKQTKKIYMRQYQEKNKERIRKKRKEYYQKNKEKLRIQQQLKNQELRQKVIERLGGCCVVCEYKGVALQIDHIHGGGYQERKENKHLYAMSYLRHLLTLSDDVLFAKYQLLCANHNWEKRYRNAEHNHHTMK